MELPYTNFEDALGYFYESELEFTDVQFWKSMALVLKVADEQIIPSLYTSESFIFKIFKFLTALPYKKNTRKILKITTQFLDPSPQIFKKVIQQLVPCLQSQIPCLSTLNTCLSFYNSIFEQQSPTNENLDSHIYLYGEEQGIVVKEQIKWPFQKGGTLAFWYNMSEKTKECKLFQFLNEEKVGFEIVMRNKKIYIQKEQDETKFRLIKNTSSFLCDAIFNKNVKLCIEFETRKKFFQPYLSINLIMNNFALNGVEIDSFATNASLFRMKLFKSFHGKFYTCLIMSDKLATQQRLQLFRVDQLNNQKGFIYETDIRNFTYLFDNIKDRVLLLFSAIRSATETSCPQEPEPEPEIEDELKQPIYNITKPIKTYLFDAIGIHTAQVANKSYCYHNLSKVKEIGNYGGFSSLLPFTNLLQVCCSKDNLYCTALDQYLQLIRFIFQNKADSIERACHVQFFKYLAYFFQKTKMQGFTYETITKIKQVYIALNTRMLREKFIQEVIWGVNFGIYLSEENFVNYIKLIKTFYNEDIQSSLHTFDITKIIHYILEKLDTPDCCYQHTGSNFSASRIKNYSQILLSFLEIIENIILIKRSEPDLESIFKKTIQAFGLSISPCFIEALILFIQNLFLKDQFIQRQYLDFLSKNMECKFYLYKCLSCCPSWRVKGKMIAFILKVLEANFFNDQMKQREMLTLCARYPTMNYLRSSSVKSKSQENRDSMDYSEDKLSLNSATMHKLIIINPIENKDEILLDDFQTLEIIFNWAFSEQVAKLTAEDHENPGLLILMELYKGTTYKLREQMSGIIKQKMKLIRFSPELMAWAIQCALIAEYDLIQSKSHRSEIEATKDNLIQLISTYNFLDADEQENNELSIIKLVYSSVKSKYPDDITKVAGNTLFFIICDKKMQIFTQQLKQHDHADLVDYDRLCSKIISNVFTFMNEYYVIKGDGDESQFDEDMAEIMEKDNLTILEIMDKILQIFVLVSTVKDRKIIEQSNAERNHLVITMLFPQKEKDKQKINIMFLIFGVLQNVFDFFEDLEIQPKKKSLNLIKKYMIFVIELTENSGSARLQSLEDDLKNMFLLNLSFFEQRYHQYFYYPYERHKNTDFQVENRIRKSIDQVKRTFYNIFLDLIQLVQYIDEKGDSQHKSFYELMKPKRKPVHKYSLKHLYPAIWKKVDQKIKEFLCLKREVLRKQAQQKLESHILLKKISQACTTIEKNVAKKIYIFVQAERKQSDSRQKKSVNFYKISESQKCRHFCECEEELLENRLKILEEEKIYINKQKQQKSISKGELRSVSRKLWNENRIFAGFWTNIEFYQFCQNQPMKSNNQLQKFYQRVRSRRQTKYFLTPFIKINALEIGKTEISQEPVDASESFLERVVTSKNQKRIIETASDKFINGLQFIKRKVYSKLVKSITAKQEQNHKSREGQKVFIVENVIWVRPMKVNGGFLKIESGKISYCLKPGKNHEHISLFKNHSLEPETLIKSWSIGEMDGLVMRRFLLKQNSVEIYFKTRKSVFFCFYGSSPEEYATIINELTLLCSLSNIGPDNILNTVVDPIKNWETTQLTQRWLNYEISNFDYLMCLNMASGRTNCDLNQYPVMPWVFSQYLQTRFKKYEDKYRDFNKNTAQLGKQQRIKKFQQIYQSLSQNYTNQFPVPHYYGFHYSNLGIILQYLIRIYPYSLGAKTLQGDKFDIPDRLFYSIPQSFKCAISQMSDLRQLIPQFFYFPEFLINSQCYDFGNLQDDNKKVNHVELPDGCLNAYDFIQHHREGLESKQVSLNLHKWIDIIFGYKNSGKQADKHMNTYHFLTHEANCDRIDLIEDCQQKEAMESQMAYYGKTPSQIFTRAHPQRQPKITVDFDLWDKTAFSVSENFGKLFKDEQQILVSTICFSYCEKSKTYLILSRTGKGMVFSVDKKQIIKVNEFSINFDNIEGINAVDKTTNRRLPIENIEGNSLAIGGLWGGKLLTINLMNSATDILLKHTSTISALKYSSAYCLLFTGSSNGQLCKWCCREKRVNFNQKIYCHSGINSIQVNTDLKVVGASTQDGCLWILSLQKMDLIRLIKVQHPILSFGILKFPFYSIFIVCRNSRQYCYSLNGAKIQECEMETTDQLHILEEDCCHEKILIQMGPDLVFLKTPELQIEEKLQVGIGTSGFMFVCHQGEILVLNQAQLLVWKRPSQESIQPRKSL